MMPVASVHAAPAVDHNVRAKSPDHADHVLEYLVAPDPFGLLRRLRIAEIFGSREVQPHAVAPSCRQQFLRPDQSQLRRLFGAQVVLPARATAPTPPPRSRPRRASPPASRRRTAR